MNREVIYRPIAKAEFDDAIDWYQSHSPKSAKRFIHEVDHIISAILNQPDRFPIEFADARCAPVKGFP